MKKKRKAIEGSFPLYFLRFVFCFLKSPAGLPLTYLTDRSRMKILTGPREATQLRLSSDEAILPTLTRRQFKR